MGLLDTLKAKAGRIKGKAAEQADTRNKGKYSSQIETGAEKAKDALDRYAQGPKDEGGGRTPS